MQALNVEQELIVSTVRKFVEKEVIPVASGMDHRNEYPHELVRQMQQMGLFGLGTESAAVTVQLALVMT